jgi:triphosphatase
VRAGGEKTVQTLKLEGSVNAGLFERGEFETPIKGDVPDLTLLYDAIPADGDCGRLIRDQAAAAQLKPVFVTRIRRSVLPLRLPSGEEIECAIDEGTIESEAKSDARSTSITGVELELKQGEPARLYQVALDLLEKVPLRFDYLSKPDRGYEMLAPQHRDPVKAKPVALRKRDSVEEAFCRIARNCLDQVHSNERGVVSGHEPSSVHQMRVGLRRLRSALDLFDKILPAYPGLQDELRWIAAELGESRDWEVLRKSTVGQAMAEADDTKERLALERACDKVAIETRTRAAAAVDSVRYTRLILQYTHWLDRKGWRCRRPFLMQRRGLPLRRVSGLRASPPITRR